MITLMLNGFISQRVEQRLLLGTLGILVSMLGMILVVALPLSNNTGRLIAYLMTSALPTAFVALLSLISTNVAGYTKKTTVAAMYLIGYCVGNIIGPQTFQEKDAPRYVPAEITIIVCNGVCVLILLFIWWWYRKENASKAKVRANPEYVKLENQE